MGERRAVIAVVEGDGTREELVEPLPAGGFTLGDSISALKRAKAWVGARSPNPATLPPHPPSRHPHPALGIPRCTLHSHKRPLQVNEELSKLVDREKAAQAKVCSRKRRLPPCHRLNPPPPIFCRRARMMGGGRRSGRPRGGGRRRGRSRGHRTERAPLPQHSSITTPAPSCALSLYQSYVALALARPRMPWEGGWESGTAGSTEAPGSHLFHKSLLGHSVLQVPRAVPSAAPPPLTRAPTYPAGLSLKSVMPTCAPLVGRGGGNRPRLR